MTDKARLNFEVPKALYDWIDAESKEMGVSKAAWLIMTLHQVKKAEEVRQEMPRFAGMVEQLRQVEAQRRGGEG